MILSQDQIDNIVTELTTDICDSISELFVPNVFTPNGDGSNNFFSIGKRNIVRIKGVIYNRWGKKITEWNELNYEWDGKSRSGMNLPEGTYYYIINATGADEKEYLRKGYVTLLR